MRAVSYRRELVAIATASHVYLAPAVRELPPGHPKLRFVAALCLNALDVARDAVPAPYDQEDAELNARTLLITDEAFERLRHEPDERIAACLGVPREQVAGRRGAVVTTSDHGPQR